MATTANIDADKSRIVLTIPTLIALVSALVAAGGSYMASAADVKRIDQTVAPVAKEQQVQDLRLQRLEDNYAHIVKSLEEIKAEVKK